MLTSLILSSLVFSLQPAALPALSLQQRTSARCAAAFAIVAEAQAAGNPQALEFPPMKLRGKEFFVQASARLMAEAKLSRTQINALLSAEAQKLWDEDKVEEVMPGCLLLLDASGI